MLWAAVGRTGGQKLGSGFILTGASSFLGCGMAALHTFQASRRLALSDAFEPLQETCSHGEHWHGRQTLGCSRASLRGIFPAPPPAVAFPCFQIPFWKWPDLFRDMMAPLMTVSGIAEGAVGVAGSAMCALQTQSSESYLWDRGLVKPVVCGTAGPQAPPGTVLLATGLCHRKRPWAQTLLGRLPSAPQNLGFLEDHV